MDTQKSERAVFALYKLELKRYISSWLYFMNTFVGNVIALIFAFVCLFGGVESFFNGVENFPQGLMEKIFPFLLAIMLTLTPMTASAISIEGRGWEQTKSLPVESRTIMQAKLLTQFTFSLPTALISSCIISIALKLTGLSLLWIFVVPIAYALFSGVMGLFVNIKHPIFNGENEAIPVKQSSAVLICMLISLLSGLAPLFSVALLPDAFFDLGVFVITLAFLGFAWACYRKIIRVRLNDIDEK